MLYKINRLRYIEPINLKKNMRNFFSLHNDFLRFLYCRVDCEIYEKEIERFFQGLSRPDFALCLKIFPQKSKKKSKDFSFSFQQKKSEKKFQQNFQPWIQTKKTKSFSFFLKIFFLILVPLISGYLSCSRFSFFNQSSNHKFSGMDKANNFP